MAKFDSDSRALLKRFIGAVPKAEWPTDEARRDAAEASQALLPALLRAQHYLETSGWLESVRLRRPVNGRGRSVPWYTYAAIHFLSGRDLSGLKIFEFGSGGSTIWWANKAEYVWSVEHDAGWVAEMMPKLPANTSYFHREDSEDGPYARMAAETGERFDIIVNDGRDRINVMRRSIDTLTERGVVIWDNADRGSYQPGFDLLTEAGFRRLDFHGHGPINGKAWLTSIFYRDGNCLGI